jgi:uncharacterized membrane protein
VFSFGRTFEVLGYYLSVFFHILAATVWVGGLIFFAAVAIPMIRNTEFAGTAPRIVEWIGMRFRYVGWITLGLLVATGTTNLLYRGFGPSDWFSPGMWTGYFGTALAYKLIMVSIILIISALHDFYIGPRATRLWQKNPDAPQAVSYRKAASWIGRANLILALAILACAVMLVRGIPF